MSLPYIGSLGHYQTMNQGGGVLLLAGLCLSLMGGAFAEQTDSGPGPQGHAHNDYVHKRPLLDALDHGFNSVEADVFLVDGDLLLGHHRSEVRPGRSLLSHYIKPLAERIKKEGGRVHRNSDTFHLLIDFKTDGDAAYQVLQEQLKPYLSLLTEFSDTQTQQRAITIIITGNSTIPKVAIASQSVRWVGCDGRVRDLKQQPNPHLIPWISEAWYSQFKWQGKGALPKAERMKLKSLVKQAHANGQTLRFWAVPDMPESWAIQQQAGVDWINTDRLAKFEEFVSEKETPAH